MLKEEPFGYSIIIVHWRESSWFMAPPFILNLILKNWCNDQISTRWCIKQFRFQIAIQPVHYCKSFNTVNCFQETVFENEPLCFETKKCKQKFTLKHFWAFFDFMRFLLFLAISKKILISNLEKGILIFHFHILSIKPEIKKKRPLCNCALNQHKYLHTQTHGTMDKYYTILSKSLTFCFASFFIFKPSSCKNDTESICY